MSIHMLGHSQCEILPHNTCERTKFHAVGRLHGLQEKTFVSELCALQSGEA